MKNTFISTWQQFLLLRELNNCDDSFKLLRLQTIIQIVTYNITSFYFILFDTFDTKF